MASLFLLVKIVTSYRGNRVFLGPKSIGFRWSERKVPATFCVSCYLFYRDFE